MKKKTWKKQIRNMLLCVLLLFTAIYALDIHALAQEKSTLSCMVETEKTEIEEILKVKIVLEGENEIASGQTVLLYDQEKVKLSNVKKGNALSGESIAMADVNSDNVGEIKVTFLCAIDKWVSDGELIIAEFELLEQNVTEAEFVLSETELSNTDFEVLDINLKNGELSVQYDGKENEQSYESEDVRNVEETFSEDEAQKNDSVESNSERVPKEDLGTSSEKNEVEVDDRLDKNMLLGGLSIFCVMIVVGIVYVRKKQR